MCNTYNSFPFPQLNSSKKQINPSLSFELLPIQCTQVRSFKNREIVQNQCLKKLTRAIIFHLSNQQYSSENNTQYGFPTLGRGWEGSNPAPAAHSQAACSLDVAVTDKNMWCRFESV